ncbi:cyclin-A1-4-like isoform X2 [Malania oleifera]|uniref:cyclin-A1-4-like isoform X2 n=1 Tax=Malania oleifera TaxID=397392 RepID=UPI0025AE8D29|nr:cyclin-A1-4-like isoform X2 [Malania oleifera]
MPPNRNRQSSLSASSTLRRPSASENAGKKVTATIPPLAKKRPALSNLTNQKNGPKIAVRTSGVASAAIVPCAAKIVKLKKGSSTCINDKSLSEKTLLPSLNVKPTRGASCKDTSFLKTDQAAAAVLALPAQNVDTAHDVCSKLDTSPIQSDGSISLDETMSTCESLRSPEFEYIDNDDASAVNSIERKASNSLYISEQAEVAGGSKRDILQGMETLDKIVKIDNNFVDPQECATIASDIYKHLRASEIRKRPSSDFMERVQIDINASMRAILIDWLVEVAEEYRLLPDTLYLTVNYIDRYLSGNAMNRKQLQLLGVACMLIASKYEEICAPQVEEFCYITDNTYVKEEVLQMESAVLNYLKFEMTTPTVRCFLRRFVRAAQGINEVPSLQLECLANYIAELSLLEYSMLCYAPSLIAASATFLAKFILLPSKKPWNSSLVHYTLYQPSDLCDCVNALHRLYCNNHGSSLPAIREKYSQHKYKTVAKKYCPQSIPLQFFHDQCN